jgi:hypothetical protein
MRNRRKIAWPMAIVLVGASLQVVLASTPALACAHNTEQNIFAKDVTTDAYSAANSMYIGNRALNSGCKADAEAHSTVHVKNTAFTKFAEVGWHEDWACDTCSNHEWNLFWEVHDGQMIIGHLGNGADISCCQNARFKVEYQSGTDSWHFWWDQGANGGFVRVGDSDGQYAAFAHGIPMGETARRGGIPTGASDHQWDLKYAPCVGCSTQFWTLQTTYLDTITNWHRVEGPTDHEYDIVKD